MRLNCMQTKQFKYLLFNWELMLGHQTDEAAAATIACSLIWNLCKAVSICDLMVEVITMQPNLNIIRKPEGVSKRVRSLM